MSKYCWVIIVCPPLYYVRLLHDPPRKHNNNKTIRSRRNKTGSGSVQGNGAGINSSAKMASTTPLITSSSSSIPSSSSSSSSSSSTGKRGGGVHPFHHRPSYAAPTRTQSAVANVGQKLLPDNNNATVALTPGSGSGSIEGVQDRVNRSVFIMPQPTHTLQTKYYYHNYYYYYHYLAFLLFPINLD